LLAKGPHLAETFEPLLVANCEVFSFLCAPQWSCYMRDGLVVNPCPTRTLTNPPRIVHAVIFQPQVEFANADAYTVSLPHFSGGRCPVVAATALLEHLNADRSTQLLKAEPAPV
jgi:hypothetical protein